MSRHKKKTSKPSKHARRRHMKRFADATTDRILRDAVKDAQEYTWQTLKAAFRPGMGQHIPDRLFWAREDDPAEESH